MERIHNECIINSFVMCRNIWWVILKNKAIWNKGNIKSLHFYKDVNKEKKITWWCDNKINICDNTLVTLNLLSRLRLLYYTCLVWLQIWIDLHDLLLSWILKILLVYILIGQHFLGRYCLLTFWFACIVHLIVFIIIIIIILTEFIC